MLIKIKAFPGSKKDKVIKKKDNNFEVKVKEKPLKGRANKAVLILLASYFNLPLNKIKIVRGFKQKNKIIELIGE
jgi:uncharacterized protein YggU (UPF0235/DUF167 family)